MGLGVSGVGVEGSRSPGLRVWVLGSKGFEGFEDSECSRV